MKTFYKPNDLSYNYDYVLYENLPEKYYITNINYNNITKISITSKITKVPNKIFYEVQKRMMSKKQKQY